MLQSYISKGSTKNVSQFLAINTSIKSLYNMIEDYKEDTTEQGFGELVYSGVLSGGYEVTLDKHPLVETPVVGFIEDKAYYLGNITKDGKFAIAIGSLNEEYTMQSKTETKIKSVTEYKDQESVPDDYTEEGTKSTQNIETTSAWNVVRNTKRTITPMYIHTFTIDATYEHETSEGEIYYTYDYTETISEYEIWDDDIKADYSSATISVNMRYICS